ncbi:zinc ribbon domain-containing protein [Chlamydiota bacterium]
MLLFVFLIIIIIYFIIDTLYLDYIEDKKDEEKSVKNIDASIISASKKIGLFKTRLLKRRVCSQCKNTIFDTDIICLDSKEVTLFSVKPHKFLKITCKECGYTDLYNLNSYINQDIFDPLPLDEEKYGLFLYHSQTFSCLSCKATAYSVKSVFVKRRGVSRLINFQPNELIVVSCNTCFKSIFFNIELFLEHKEQVV